MDFKGFLKSWWRDFDLSEFESSCWLFLWFVLGVFRSRINVRWRSCDRSDFWTLSALAKASTRNTLGKREWCVSKCRTAVLPGNYYSLFWLWWLWEYLFSRTPVSPGNLQILSSEPKTFLTKELKLQTPIWLLYFSISLFPWIPTQLMWTCAPYGIHFSLFTSFSVTIICQYSSFHVSVTSFFYLNECH